MSGGKTVRKNPSVSDFHYQARGGNFAIGNVVVDVFAAEMLAGLIRIDFLDDSVFSQLIDDVVALGIRIRVGGVRDLECKPREREAGIFGARSDPVDACFVRRSIGV